MRFSLFHTPHFHNSLISSMLDKKNGPNFRALFNFDSGLTAHVTYWPMTTWATCSCLWTFLQLSIFVFHDFLFSYCSGKPHTFTSKSNSVSLTFKSTTGGRYEGFNVSLTSSLTPGKDKRASEHYNINNIVEIRTIFLVSRARAREQDYDFTLRYRG